MSTTLLIGRTPAFSSRRCNHSGEGATDSPERAVTLKIPPSCIRSALSSSTARRVLAQAGATAANRVLPPLSAATSRAMPCIERPSGRLAVIASSST